jgi:NAD(P)-dependent dehydrogenase (short-subunit alcohol dehydrogenase family)
MQIEFNGAIALITGAASGIGRETALALHRSGAKIAAADRDEAALATLHREIGSLSLALDITDDLQVDAAVMLCENELGPISILVTAAGILQRPRAPQNVPMAEWDKVMATNLRGTYRTCVAAGTRMVERRKGSIITVSSVMGITPGPLYAYSPAKAGVISLTQSLAAEWASSGVRVNGVAPGFTSTPALNMAMNFGVLQQETLAAGSAQGRIVNASEVAQAIVFLASDAASAITGVTLPVDGGYLAASGFRSYASRAPQGSN